MKQRKSWLRTSILTRNRPSPQLWLLKASYIRQFREDEMLCFRVLTGFRRSLED